MHLPLPLLLLIPFFLAACSENLIYNEATPHIAINVQNVSDTIEIGDTVYFKAEIPRHINNYGWIINDGRPIGQPNFPWSFDSSGVYDIKFYAIDILGDTLSKELFIVVSGPPVCEDAIIIKTFQGSPIFKWKCQDVSGDALTYNFILKDKGNRDRIILDTALQEDSLQRGTSLEAYNSLEINLTATNKYGYKTRLDSIWSVP